MYRAEGIERELLVRRAPANDAEVATKAAKASKARTATRGGVSVCRIVPRPGDIDLQPSDRGPSDPMPATVVRRHGFEGEPTEAPGPGFGGLTK